MEQTTLLKRPWGAHPFQTCSSRPRPAGGRWMRPACAASQREGPSTAAAASRRQLLGTALLAAPLLLPAAGQAAEAFMSSEGFAFQHPTDWVVAFDRSGGRGDGAVTVVGNFRTFDTVAVFRTDLSAVEGVDPAGGLTEDLGFRLAVAPQQDAASTMRFQLISGGLVPGSSSGSSSGDSYYDYEYSIETCRGEIIETSGGRVQCLGPQGQDLDTLRRHHVGRALRVGRNLYILNASAPEDRWPEVELILRGIVASFRN